MISRSLELSAEEITAGARFLGDHNPLHGDPAAAAASRFGGLIASGPHVAGLHATMIPTELTAYGAPLGLEFTVRYVAPVKPGTITMTWGAVKERGTNRQVRERTLSEGSRPGESALT